MRVTRKFDQRMRVTKGSVNVAASINLNVDANVSDDNAADVSRTVQNVTIDQGRSRRERPQGPATIAGGDRRAER